MPGLDVDRQVDQVAQRLGETVRGKLIAHSGAFPGGLDQSATSEAGQVVRDVRAPEVQVVGEISRVSRPVEQDEKDPSAGGVGQCGTDTLQYVEVNKGRHNPAEYIST